MANRFSNSIYETAQSTPAFIGTSPLKEFGSALGGVIGGALPGLQAGFQSFQQGSTAPYKRFLAEANQRITDPRNAPDLALNFGLGTVGSLERKVAGEGESALQKLINAIRGAKKATPALEAAQTVERARRAGAVSGIFGQQQGQKGFFQSLGALKGELVERPTFEPLQGKASSLNQLDIDSLFNQAQAHPTLDVYEKISVSNGLQKILEGNLPQRSQLGLMEDVFGKDLVEAVLSKRSGLEKLKDVITEVVNIPRSLITSFDMSAVLRQGVLLSTTKPKPTFGALKEMFRQTFSPKNFDEWLKDVPNNPFYKEMKSSGLYISDPTKVSGGLGAREERFMTNIAQKIPVLGSIVRASERAYVSFLNKLRVDTFKQLATQFKEEGVLTPENMKSLSNFINTATGRGDLGMMNRSAQVLNNVFFSPRLIASRFNMLNPAWYAKQTPPVRKEAIKTMAKFVGVGITVLTLAKAGGASVETDPRSTDFGKIRVGNTRWDIWGGFQQWVRVFSQLVSGERKTANGELVDLDPTKFPFESRKDVAERFLRGKFAPVPGLALELLEGQKLFGEKISFPKEVAENIVPLYLQDMKEAITELGPEALFLVGLPAFFGVGSQTYQEKRAVNRFNR